MFTSNIVVEANAWESWMCSNVFHFEGYRCWWFLIRRQVDVTQANSKLSGCKRSLSWVSRAEKLFFLSLNYEQARVVLNWESFQPCSSCHKIKQFIVFKSHGKEWTWGKYCSEYWQWRTYQWAAVNTYLDPINDPPHQNSVLFGPWRKIAASHGHWPVGASTPPTILPEEYSCWPQSSESTKFPIGSIGRLETRVLTELGVCVTVLDTVKTGTKGRWVDVETGFKNRLGRVVVGRVVNFNGRWVVDTALEFSDIGQQTPGTKRLLKHSDSRKCVKSNKSPGQLLRSSHFPGRPSGVLHLFSPSLLW